MGRQSPAEDAVLKPHPGYEGAAESEVEQSFVGDGEDDEHGGQGKEDDHQTMQIVIVWLQSMGEWQYKGAHCFHVNTTSCLKVASLSAYQVRSSPESEFRGEVLSLLAERPHWSV